MPPQAGQRSRKSHQSHSLRGARPPVAGLRGAHHGIPDGPDVALDGEQVALVGGVAHDLAVAEVDQLELARDLAVDAPEHQRVELHLEQRLGLEQLARRPAGLVVDDAHRAVGGDVETVDVPAQGEPLDLGLDVELAGRRLEPGGVLEVEPLLDEGLRGGEPALLGQQLVVVDHRRELGPLVDQGGPSWLEEGDGGLRGALGRGEVEEVLEHRVHQGAPRGGRGRWALELVDGPEPEQQRALLEVRRAARGQGWGHGAKVCRPADMAPPPPRGPRGRLCRRRS